MATAMMQQSRSAQGHYSYSRSRHSCCHSTYSSCCCLPSLLVQLLPVSELRWAIAAILQLSMFLPAQQLQLFLLTFIASMATLQQSFCMIVATSTTLLVLPPCHPHPQEHPHAMNRSCSWNYPLTCYHYQLSVSNFGLKTCTTPYSLISHSSPW